MIFIELKSMAGVNYVRATDVIAVQYTDPTRCSVMLQGGVGIQCAESARSVVEKIEAAVKEATAGNALNGPR